MYKISRPAADNHTTIGLFPNEWHSEQVFSRFWAFQTRFWPKPPSVLAVCGGRRCIRMQKEVWVNNPHPTEGFCWWPRDRTVINSNIYKSRMKKRDKKIFPWWYHEVSNCSASSHNEWDIKTRSDLSPEMAVAKMKIFILGKGGVEPA